MNTYPFYKKMLLALAASSMSLSAFSMPLLAQEMEDETSQTSLQESTLNGVETSIEEMETSQKATNLETPGTGTIYEWKVYAKELADQYAKASESEKEQLKAKMDQVDQILETFEMTPMYRLYNKSSGEHFYTASQEERDQLVEEGWKDEGIGWYAPIHSGLDVYRLYNPEGDHHYTTDTAERDALVKAGWKDEGIGWKSFDGDEVNASAVYRQYNPNDYIRNHNYTVSQTEANHLTGGGWLDEKIGWYGLTPYSKVQTDRGIQYMNIETLEPLTGLQTIEGDAYLLDDDGYLTTLTGLVQEGDKIYILDTQGQKLTGWTEYEGKTYYLDPKTGEAKIGSMVLSKEESGKDKNSIVCFGDDGAMLKDCTVDGVSYGPDGEKQTLSVDERIMLDCYDVYDLVGKDLRNCFDWTYQTIVYKAFNPQWRTPPEGRTHVQNFALYGLESHTGNCYTFASTFLSLARNLGYEGRLAKGTVKTVNGQEEHGWAELNIDGKWYIFDGSFAQGFKADLCYMQPKERPTFVYTVESYHY
ncbi:MAG: hypothetical protein HDR44_01345 [Allobaculum sp.]|nr:hypothetical protein [Allobaculum sp.]